MKVPREKINPLLAAIRVPVDHPDFFPRIFSLVAKEQKETFKQSEDSFEKIFSEEYDDLSKRLDRSRLQDSVAVRNVMRTRRLADLLINDKGDILNDLLPEAIAQLKQHMYSLGPDRQHDSRRQRQILSVLTTLQNDKDAHKALKGIAKPHNHRLAEQIIRDTLSLNPNAVITDAHARKAALSAWLCYLRQNVGSCFATAPAIIIHDEQPIQFLKDLNELLNTGRLRKVFGGG